MIIVIGNPAWGRAEPPGPAGRACDIAIAAAAAGGRVELVGRAGDDPDGDALMIALARSGVGHAAILRDPARPTRVLEAPPATDDEMSVLDDGTSSDPGTGAVTDGGPQLEAQDVALGLQYLATFTVLVVADDVPASVLPVAAEAAVYAGAHLVVLLAPGAPEPTGLPAASTVLTVPDDDPGGAFAALVGRYAASLHGGARPADAFAAAMAESGASPVA